MSIYKSAFSGAQMDDTFDKVQNKKITAADVGAVPPTRQVNGKALSSDITLTATDVGARADTWMPTAAQVCNGITFYRNLTQVSSSLTTDSTPFDVADAMTNNSILFLATSGSHTYAGGLIPKAENGILVIEKDSIARVSFEFIGENTGFYDSFMRSIAGNFKGWRRHYTTANLTVATAAPTSALANDAQVQVYDA